MAETIEFTPRPPRTKRARMTAETRRKISETSKGKEKSDLTKTKMSNGRQRLFVRNNRLEAGQIYISWIKPGKGRRHAIINESEPIEISRDGVHWFKISGLSESLDKILK
ncbi:hypothetical protein KKH23_08990 [Patescibacteria group bacterium]|nr:hypothetical protein [Patescibacteria group bacterium]MBU0847302.1 hypothetical protein [Patescibacteria group bacterium]